MNKQEFYRDEYAKRKLGWQRSLDIYRDLIDDLVSVDTYILDVGCGHGELLKNVYGKTEHSYGLEPDAQALAKNHLIKNKIVGTVEKMPFADNFFDLVVLEWVLEHLPDPKLAFREIFRVLKPGGKVIFVTPNAWNYNVWLIRLIPERFHDFLTQKLYDRQEHDTYAKKYLINTPRKVKKILPALGFHNGQIILNGDPSYISFNKLTFYFACLLEKIFDWQYLNFLRVHLIAVYEKPVGK